MEILQVKDMHGDINFIIVDKITSYKKFGELYTIITLVSGLVINADISVEKLTEELLKDA